MNISFNGADLSIGSVEELGSFLDWLDRIAQFEFWIRADHGPSMCMLRNGEDGWLMYLQFHGDGSFVTQGDRRRKGTCTYELANGQIDEYPLSWCIDLKQCYEAIAYFFANNGARWDVVAWQVG
jgi:hypothetical protein